MYHLTRCVVLLLVYTVNTATCQVKVEAFIGDNILLPCRYSEVKDLSEKTAVFWVDKDDGVLMKITGFKEDLSSQSEKFKGRVNSSSVEQHKKGNFSIQLKTVQQSDSGPYDCLIKSLDFEQQVLLNVSGTRRNTAAATDPTAPSGGAAGTLNPLHSTSLSLLFTFLCFY